MPRCLHIRIFMNTLIRVANADGWSISFFFFFRSSILPILFIFATISYLCRRLSPIILSFSRQGRLTNHDWHSIYFTHKCYYTLNNIGWAYCTCMYMYSYVYVCTYASYIYMSYLHRFLHITLVV